MVRCPQNCKWNLVHKPLGDLRDNYCLVFHFVVDSKAIKRKGEKKERGIQTGRNVGKRN